MSTRERSPRLELWAKRLLIAICAIVALVALGFVGSAFLPRWWAHRVGDQVNGSIAGGIAVGLFYGFVFTALPLAMLRLAFARRRPPKTWAIMFAVAVVLALPNLLTLGVVLGNGNAAHAGQRTFDVDAPAFRDSSLAGACLAVVAFALLEYVRVSRGRTLRELRRLRAEERARKETEAPPTS